jgi:hypothetical protein
MFPCLPTRGNIVRKQNLLPEKQKCFLANSETFYVSLCFSLMFPSVCPLLRPDSTSAFSRRNIGRKQCFRNNACFLVCPGLNALDTSVSTYCLLPRLSCLIWWKSRRGQSVLFLKVRSFEAIPWQHILPAATTPSLHRL